MKTVKILFKNIIYTNYNNAINLMPDNIIHKSEVEIFIKC